MTHLTKTLLATAALSLTLSACQPSSPTQINDLSSARNSTAQMLKGDSISAQDALRAAPDIDIAYDTFTLDNGLRVVVHEDRKTPTVAVSVWYNVGSKDEKPGKTGFAHLFEHLMFNGSENYNDEYFGPFERAGATGMNGTTWFDRTNYFETVPTPALDMALWMESDRMTHFEGAITQENLDKQRGVVQNEKRQGDNAPYGLAEYRILEGLFPEGHPYRWSTIGSMEDLDAASLEDVKEWFAQYYGASNTVVVLAGDIDVDTAKPLMEKFFGDAPVGEPLYQKKSWIPERKETVREVMYDQAAPTARVDRYWAVPGRTTQENAVLALAARVLGSGKTSRLYKELVEEREIATDVSVYVEEHSLASIFTVNVRVAPDADVAEVERVTDEIIARFLKDGPTNAELEQKKTGFNASTIRGLERIGGFSGKAAVLAEGMLYADNPNFWKVQLGWINAANKQLVQKTAQAWLSDGAYQLVILPFKDMESATTGADRSALPDIGGIPALSFPEIEETTLSNGLKVVVATRDAVPVVNISLDFDAGYAADSKDKMGAASFASNMMYNGTTSRSAQEISAEAANLGAQISTGAGLDTSTTSLNVLIDKLDPALDLFADIVRNPAYSDEEIEKFRRKRLAGIDAEKSQPVQLALRLLPPAMYGSDHSYGIAFTGSGTAETTQNMTREDLLAYHRNFIRPDNATLYVVGATTMDKIKPKLEAKFGDWTAPESSIPPKNITPVDVKPETRLIIVDKPGSPQSLILGGHLVAPSGDPNRLELETMNEILGGSFTARVNMNLREDKSWAYGAYTFTQEAEGQRPWLIYAPVQTDKTKESLMELYSEINGYLSSDPAREDELERVIENNVRSLPGQFETSSAVLSSMRSAARYGNPYNNATNRPEQYAALSLGGIRESAKATLKPDSITWVIVGDREEIEGPLRSLGLADIEFWDADGNVVE